MEVAARDGSSCESELSCMLVYQSARGKAEKTYTRIKNMAVLAVRESFGPP